MRALLRPKEWHLACVGELLRLIVNILLLMVLLHMYIEVEFLFVSHLDFRRVRHHTNVNSVRYIIKA